MRQVCVLIPAFNPDWKLVSLVKSLKTLGVEDLVIVDDGSSASCRPVFDKLARDWGCVVLHHAINLGKGRALKTGLNECLLRFPKSIGVVTVDADGQHAAEDIFRVGEKLSENREKVILGCRSFHVGVPLRSRFGNELTKLVFASLTGRRISDTQTGLRGIPRSRIPELLRITGERYEYEINMLLATRTGGIPLLEVPIKTIYTENNRQSHFNPLLDSMRIYFQLLRFAFSSIITALVDFVVFWVVLVESGDNIAVAMVVARAVASVGNFFLSRNLVFHSRSKLVTTMAKYYLLVTLFGTVSYFAIQAARQNLGIPTLPAKAIAEILMFLASFAIQRDFIFYPTTKASSENTDWDSYYSRPYRAAHFARRTTTSMLLRVIRRWLKVEQPRIAELGGANSCCFEELAAGLHPAEYLIVDKNQLGLEQFERRLGKPPFVHLESRDLLQSAGERPEYDLVFSVGLIEHFDPVATARVIDAHFGYLRSGGVAVISYPTPTFLYRATRCISENLGLWIFHDERPIRLPEIEPALRRHGEILETLLHWPIFLTQGVVVVRKH